MGFGTEETAGVVAAPDGSAPGVTPGRVRSAVVSTYLAFGGTGVGFASIASRVPQIRDLLHVTPASLGLLLLCIALGSMVQPAAVRRRRGDARDPSHGARDGRRVRRRPAAPSRSASSTAVAPVAIGFVLVGIGNGMWDVAMNVQAAHVEQALGRSIMSRFHAGFSVGTVLGAGDRRGHGRDATSRSACTCWRSPSLIALVVPWGIRDFLPDAPQHTETSDTGRNRRFAAWTEPRTLLIGLFVLCMAFTEGTGNDWLSIAMIDGYHTEAVRGHGRVHGVPERDDARALVRPGGHRPVRTSADAAGLGSRRARRPAGRRVRLAGTRSRFSARRCGASAPRSASRPGSAPRPTIRKRPQRA